MSKRPSSGSEGQTTSPKNLVSWDEARLKQALPRVIGRCMSYSAATCFDDALVGAVRRFYGIEVDVATAETDILEDDFERVRFFPWFLWDYLPTVADVAAAEGIGVGQRFLAEGELTEFERSIVRALVASTVTFVEVVQTVPELGLIVLRDLAKTYGREGRRVSAATAKHDSLELVVRDAGLATELAAGQVSLLRLVHVPSATLPVEALELGWASKGFAMLDAIYAVLPHEARPLVDAELTILLGGQSPAEAQRTLRERAPELLDFAEHVLHKLTEPPTLCNVDDEPIVLCRTFVAGSAVGLAGAAVFTTPCGEQRIWDEDQRTIGWVRPSAGGWLVESSSRERFARVREALAAVGVNLPALHSEMELARAVSQWLALGECEAWLTDSEVEAAFRGQLGESLAQWPDQPHPALGRRTPREVKGEPGGDAVVARLLQRVRKVAGEAAGARLANLLA